MDRRKRDGKSRGFTLIELLIVMVIIGLLAGLVGVSLFKRVGQSKQETARAQISNFDVALDVYRLDVGAYPSTQQGLDALREKPEGVDAWNGPYLKKDVPNDPWGHAYVYKSPGEVNEYDIVSYGQDGQPGGEGEASDVKSWEH